MDEPQKEGMQCTGEGKKCEGMQCSGDKKPEEGGEAATE